jgi:hypothetical protein
VVLPSTAFKHGDYAVTASVNTVDGDAIAPSQEETFTVQNPAGKAPPDDDGRRGGGRDDRGRGISAVFDFVVHWFGGSGDGVVARLLIGLRAIVFGGF